MHKGQIGVIGGAQKSRKSWLLLNLVKTLLSPEDFYLGIPLLANVNKTVPKILYVQMEGAKNKWQERVKKIMFQTAYPDNVHWWFKPWLRLDEKESIEQLKEEVKRLEIEVLILDPLQRLHGKNEDSSSEMGYVWDNIFQVQRVNSDMDIIPAHHFKKDVGIAEGWDAFRGSSRIGGEVDWGIFTEERPKKEGQGNNVHWKFRDEPSLETVDGSDIWKTTFDEDLGLLSMDIKMVESNKRDAFFEELEKQKEWKLTEASIFMSVSMTTINKWVKYGEQTGISEYVRPSKITPAMVRFKGKPNGSKGS